MIKKEQTEDGDKRRERQELRWKLRVKRDFQAANSREVGENSTGQ